MHSSFSLRQLHNIAYDAASQLGASGILNTFRSISEASGMLILQIVSGRMFLFLEMIST
jgi:hypothetical protein